MVAAIKDAYSGSVIGKVHCANCSLVNRFDYPRAIVGNGQGAIVTNDGLPLNFNINRLYRMIKKKR